MRQMLQNRSPTVRLISSFLPNCLPPRQSTQFITSPLAQATPPSQAALSRLSPFPRGLHTAATLSQGTASPSKNPRHRESETMMGSSTSTPANSDMQQEAHHHEAAGAFPLPGAPPMSMSMPAAQDSESHSDSSDSNISNSSTHKDASAKRKAHDSAQTAGPKRAKTDDSKVLSQDINSLAITNITSNINIDIDIDIDNMTTADAPVDPIAVVKQWLAEREARPSPLTPTELNAIVALKATLGRIPEPDLGAADWVSLLHRKSHRPGNPGPSAHPPSGYRDARQQQCGAKFEFEDMVNEDKSFSTICVFTGELGAPPLRFPGEHGGLLPVDHSGTLGAPSFLKKKDARKYAAKCCVEWLMANGYMPADGSTANLSRIKPKPFRIPSTTGAAPAAQADENARPASNGTTAPPQGNATPAELTGDETATSRPSNGTPRPANGAAPANGTSHPTNSTVAPSPSPPVPTSSEEEMADFEVPATQRVKDLCETLGICQPQYIIVPSPNHGRDFFDGRANFLADDPYFEDGVGRVFGGYTKKGTRERVAEQVLVALLEISAKREAAYKTLLAYKALLEDKDRG